MATIIYFLAPESDGGLTGITVLESPDEVDNQWQAAAGHDNVMHLTQRRNENPLRINRDVVAYWGERQ